MTSDGGYSYQPAGIVVEKYADGCPSGKDIVVMFLDPFDVRVVSQWRAINEVELIMVNEWEWRSVRESYARLDEANPTGHTTADNNQPSHENED
jgi:hypothetical protein